ncbi:sunset domain-containing protein, partial [Nostocoides australiense]
AGAAAGAAAAFVAAKYGAGSVLPARDGSGPEGWAIKGNEDSMLFHTVDSPGYAQTTAEVWFETEEAATAAGFQRWDHKAQTAQEAAPLTLVDVPDGPYGPGSAAAGPRGKGPEGWAVKGNEDSKLYHTQESPWFKRTRAEVWFIDVATAEAAGFQRWDVNQS